MCVNQEQSRTMDTPLALTTPTSASSLSSDISPSPMRKCGFSDSNVHLHLWREPQFWPGGDRNPGISRGVRVHFPGCRMEISTLFTLGELSFWSVWGRKDARPCYHLATRPFPGCYLIRISNWLSWYAQWTESAARLMNVRTDKPPLQMLYMYTAYMAPGKWP